MFLTQEVENYSHLWGSDLWWENSLGERLIAMSSAGVEKSAQGSSSLGTM